MRRTKGGESEPSPVATELPHDGGRLKELGAISVVSAHRQPAQDDRSPATGELAD